MGLGRKGRNKCDKEETAQPSPKHRLNQTRTKESIRLRTQKAHDSREPGDQESLKEGARTKKGGGTK